jgi:hypothetical protein
MLPQKIVSGRQTGVDRSALDAAHPRISCGGGEQDYEHVNPETDRRSHPGGGPPACRVYSRKQSDGRAIAIGPLRVGAGLQSGKPDAEIDSVSETGNKKPMAACRIGVLEHRCLVVTSCPFVWHALPAGAGKRVSV